MVLIAVLSTSCAIKPQTDWFNDYNIAQQYALKTQKPILVAFVSPTYNKESRLLDDILLDSTFISGATKNFVLCHLVYNREDDKESNKATQERYRVATQFAISGFPTIAFITPGGFACHFCTYDATTTNTAATLALFNQQAETCAVAIEIEQRAKKASGTNKARIINELLTVCAEDSVPRKAHNQFIQEIIQLDSENKAGLQQKYTAQMTFIDAAAIMDSDPEKAIEMLNKLIENKKNSASDVQNAYYMVSYIVAMNEAQPNVVADYLQKAIDADPTSKAAEDLLLLKNTIQSIPEE